ncbi:MAG: acyl carrier protein [Clostridiales bacterium]|jgi:acyl carrier protein|nr:acyl carrier protein [Clostridium sp.]MCI6955583.1 acyl carrier protein [Clostridiales bacterium]MCI7201616.1 acyl carrier protein [Clostridiales bacterium]MDY3095860.1 acyl carrier protein [Eubacteriales bacterium]MDY4209130.1 acyl carrier protein [Eubacteriales bacterium]
MVLDKIKDMLEKQLGIDKSKITEDSDIIKDIGADSLDIVEFLMDAENEWGITIEEEDVKDLHTIGDVVKYIESRI